MSHGKSQAKLPGASSTATQESERLPSREQTHATTTTLPHSLLYHRSPPNSCTTPSSPASWPPPRRWVLLGSSTTPRANFQLSVFETLSLETNNTDTLCRHCLDAGASTDDSSEDLSSLLVASPPWLSSSRVDLGMVVQGRVPGSIMGRRAPSIRCKVREGHTHQDTLEML